MLRLKEVWTGLRRHGRRSPGEGLGEGFRVLYDLAPLGLVMLAPGGRILGANGAFCAMLGYTEDEVKSLGVDGLTHPEDLPACREFFGRVERGEIAYFEMEKRFLCKDGDTVFARVIVAASRGPDGRPPVIIAAAVDLTERRAAEETVERLNAVLEERVAQRTALLTAQQETSPDGILVVDPRGRILSYNRRFVSMWGLPRDVIEKGSDDEALSFILDKLEDPEGFARRVGELYARRDERSFDEVRLRDGRVFERYSSPIGAAGRYDGRIWYFRDVTSRVERERLLSEKSAQLARSNADLEMYAYAASHNLSSPLRKVTMLGALLENRAGSKLDDEERRMLRRMRDAAEDLASLIKEMLSMSLIGHELRPPEVVDLAEVLREVVEDMGCELESSGATVSAGDLPRLRAHRSLIYRLLHNLVGNAVKFRRDDEPPRVRLESRPAEGGVEIVVSDNGIGFEPRFADMIFRPFSRLHSSSAYDGHGIGLAVCNRVASRYGGRIAAHGVPGRGATFTVWLPESMLA